MILISVIIPFYKSEPYIEACLESVLKQTYKNLEIILVNDGSPDNSRSICEKMIRNDKRARILDTMNGGVSSARNIGIENANGDFITFVDSDDTLCLDMYEKMINCIDESIDLVCCGINRLNSKDELLFKVNMAPKKMVFTPTEAMNACLLEKEIGFNVYTKLFRTKLFNEELDLIRFPVGKLMEEANILPRIFKKCNSIIHTGFASYNYYVRENSYTTKILNEECYYIYETIENYEGFLEEWYPGVKDALLKWKIINCMNLYRRASLEYNYINKKVYNRIKKEFNKIWLCGVFSKILPFRIRIMLIETKSKLFIIRKQFFKSIN